MSHFTVLVIGDNVEEQLAPYHEFECTGEDDQYVQDIDLTDEARAKFAEHGDGGESFASFVTGWYGLETLGADALPDVAGDHKYGWMRLTAEGDVAEVIDRTNPNAKWDWWQIGGRWTGFFRMRIESLVGGAEHAVGSPGLMTAEPAPGFADQARKGDIDFDGIRDDAGDKAAQRWDAIHSVLDAHPVVRAWSVVREEHSENLEAARTAYHNQPAILALSESTDKELRNAAIGSDFEDLCALTRDEFVTRARYHAFLTFAVVKDGEWHERGEMGWFACIRNEKPEGQWEREFAAMLDGLPDDTLLTLVDCHI